MNLSKLKSGFIMALILVLVVTVIGCSNNNGKTENNGNNVNNSGNGNAENNGNGNKGNSDEGFTISFGTNDNFYAPASLTSGLPVWKEIEEKTGMKVEWDVAPGSQYQEGMQVRAAAGGDLPDIIKDPYWNPMKMVDQGIVIPLDDLIEEHAPNLKQYMEDNPRIASLMRAPDGKIYFLPAVTAGAASSDPYGLVINRTWLENLGLEEPRTLDEWYNVLKAFKEQDANGNGDPNDELPLSPNDKSGRDLRLFASAVGLHLFYSGGYYPNEDGKIEFQFMSDEAEEWVRWLNKLYEEGLIDPEMASYNEEQFNSKISRNLIGVTSGFVNNTESFNSTQKDNGFENPNWYPVLPPANEGVEGFYEEYGPLSGAFGITTSSKQPENAMKFLDYIMASKEGSRYMAFGIEGKSWEMVDGEPRFTDWAVNHPDGLSLTNALRTLGAFPTVPWIRGTEGYLADQPEAILALKPELKEKADYINDYLVPAAPLGLPTAEETGSISSIQTDIGTYLEENLFQFIMGDKEIDWDKFRSDLKAIGIDKVLEVKQAQYDRYQATLEK